MSKRSAAAKAEVFRDLLRFLWREKLWWMIPMVLVLLAAGLLVVVAQSSAVAPFIYTLF
jgi:hypothetical protein